MITQQIKLNLIPGQVFPRVNASQYDSGTRTLQMALYNGDQVFNIASGMTAFVQGTKPDKTGFQYAATITEGSNIVTLDITQQMTAVKGDVICELVISNGNNRIATVNFILYVEAAALSEDTVISETDLPLIEEAAELAERIDGIVQQVDEDAQTASDAATAAQRASEAATTAQDAAEDSAYKAEAYGTHPPYIGANGNWFVYNVTTQQYEDSGVKAQGPLSGLTDVALSTLTDGQSLIYDATSQKWMNGSVAYSSLSGKPTLGTAAAKDVPASGNASSAEVVLGSDTRLTDARTPVSHTHTKSEITDFPTLGTAAAKNSTNAVTANSTDLVESGAVYTADKGIYEVMGQNGAVNYAPINLTSQQDGIYDYDVADDKTITVTVSGTTSLSSKNISPNFTLKKGTYKFTGVATGVNVDLIVVNADTSATITSLTGNNPEKLEVVFTLSADTNVLLRIIWHSGISAGTYVFKPMISFIEYTGDYVPYAMTNRELTEEVTSITSELNYHKGARQKLFRMTTNTKLVAKVRKTAVVAWGQMVLRFVGTNNGKYYDSIAYAQFNGNGSAVSSSHITNLADADPTLTASVDSDYLIITIGNLTNYVILALDYYDNGMFNSPNHEDWIFSQEA